MIIYYIIGYVTAVLMSNIIMNYLIHFTYYTTQYIHYTLIRLVFVHLSHMRIQNYINYCNLLIFVKTTFLAATLFICNIAVAQIIIFVLLS